MKSIFKNWFKKKDDEKKSHVIISSKNIITLITENLQINSNPQTAQKQSAFHKSALGETESKDIFLGVSKQICKQIATEHANTATWDDISQLLNTPNNEHEIKLVASLILIAKANEKSKPNNAKLAYDFYFKHLANFTSWDLIDETAPLIIGNYLHTHVNYPRDDLYRLIKSRSDWDKRIALVATEPLIKNGDFTDALDLCKLCFNEISPMVLKTAGKTLKEIGKINKHVLIEFIANHQTKIPPVMLNAAASNLAHGLKKTIRRETKILNKA